VTQDDSSPQQKRRFRLPFSKRWIMYGSVALTAGILTASLNTYQMKQTAAALVLSEAAAIPPAVYRWGFSMNDYRVTQTKLRSGDILGEILIKEGLTYPQVAKLVENCRDKFNITNLRMGRNLYFITDGNGTSPAAMVYEPSPYEYVTFQLEEPYEVKVTKRGIQKEIVSASGVLETSFWQALTDNGLNESLADGMIDVLASSVDFYHQKQGDRFKVMYEQHIVEGEIVGTGKIIAAVYERDGKEYYAVNFEREGEKTTYFDFDGRPARKAFLKAPVKFCRISSRYNLNRLHPVLGYKKAHFGTDYAAPQGTPIIAVAEGTVTEATRKGGNGIYVKIKHGNGIETQYLHMSRHAKGIRSGARVAQGQTIGYVGSTGLATGPHVCFRFWKNGKQVDHLRLNLPQPEPIKGKSLEAYQMVRDSLLSELGKVPYRTFKQEKP